MVLGIGFVGCKNAKEETGCVLTVHTSYSGYGIDGTNLGSGSFEEAFPVDIKDVFYEEYGGHWCKNPTKYLEEELILTIKEVNEDNVVIQVDDKEMTLEYNCKCNVNSVYVVCDGTNYYYEICFTKNKE